MCATTPASELGLARQGRLAQGALADLVVVDADLRVEQTWVGGRQAGVLGRVSPGLKARLRLSPERPLLQFVYSSRRPP
jgi:N-acetylglucosamine-6-phosphate deacetylase